MAAAVACNADCVVTFNRKDFSLAPVTELSIAITGPSTFLKNLWSLDSSLVLDRLEAQAQAISIPVGLLLDRLAKTVPAFVDLVRQAGLRPSE